MRLILVDLPSERRHHFDPVALSRPICELRCGMSALADKLVARTRATDVACFVPEYLAGTYAQQRPWPINRPEALAGDDLLLVDGRVRADASMISPSGAAPAAPTSWALSSAVSQAA